MLYLRNTHGRGGRALFGIATLGLLCAAAVAANAQSTMLDTEDFESAANGDPVDWGGWSQSGNSVIVTNGYSYHGAQSAMIPTGVALTNNFTATNVVRVWTEMYARPTLESGYSGEPVVDASATAFFYFSSNGYVKAWDGDHFEELTNLVGGASASPYTNPSEWLRMTVFQNYDTGKWSLFTNNVLLGEGIDFNISATKYYNFAVRNRTDIDETYVHTWFPTNTFEPHQDFDFDEDNDGSGDIWEVHWFANHASYGAGQDPDNDGLRNEEEFVRGTDPTSALSASWLVPYYQAFNDGSVTGLVSGLWRGMTVSGIAAIGTNAVEGTHALCLTNGTVSFSATTPSSDDTNVWVQVYSKPAPYDDGGGASPPSVDANTTAAFYIQSGTGKIRVRNGGVWQDADNITTVDTTEWCGYAVHLDYDSDTWALFVSTNDAHGDTMVRATKNVLAFNNGHSATYFTTASVESDEETYVDAMAVSEAYDQVETVHSNVVVHMPLDQVGRDIEPHASLQTQ